MSRIRNMYATDSILMFSFRAGTWLGARFRMSFLLPVVLMAIMWRLQSPVLGLIGGGILLASIILHEVGHLIGARLTCGDAEEILLWPLGGLIPVQPGPGHRAMVVATIAGPLANLIVAGFCFFPLHEAGVLLPLMNPFGEFTVNDSEAVMLTALRMTFLANWCLVLFNMLPFVPLDGGNALRWFLSLRFDDLEVRDLMIRLGLVASLFGLLAGFVFDISGVTALSAFILILHIHDAVSMYHGQTSSRDESFMGYDFSEGYTSLDRSASDWGNDEYSASEDGEDVARTGLLERWRSRRSEERQRREQEERKRDEQQLDGILAKLHQHGRDALTVAEVMILNRVSQRLRERDA